MKYVIVFIFFSIFSLKLKSQVVNDSSLSFFDDYELNLDKQSDLKAILINNKIHNVKFIRIHYSSQLIFNSEIKLVLEKLTQVKRVFLIGFNDSASETKDFFINFSNSCKKVEDLEFIDGYFISDLSFLGKLNQLKKISFTGVENMDIKILIHSIKTLPQIEQIRFVGIELNEFPEIAYFNPSIKTLILVYSDIHTLGCSIFNNSNVTKIYLFEVNNIILEDCLLNAPHYIKIDNKSSKISKGYKKILRKYNRKWK